MCSSALVHDAAAVAAVAYAPAIVVALTAQVAVATGQLAVDRSNRPVGDDNNLHAALLALAVAARQHEVAQSGKTMEVSAPLDADNTEVEWVAAVAVLAAVVDSRNVVAQARVRAVGTVADYSKHSEDGSKTDDGTFAVLVDDFGRPPEVVEGRYIAPS